MYVGFGGSADRALNGPHFAHFLRNFFKHTFTINKYKIIFVCKTYNLKVAKSNV